MFCDQLGTWVLLRKAAGLRPAQGSLTGALTSRGHARTEHHVFRLNWCPLNFLFLENIPESRG